MGIGLRTCLVGLLGLGLSCAPSPKLSPPVYATMPARGKDAEVPPSGRLPEDTAPRSYKLELTLLPEKETYTGRVEIEVALDRPRETLWLHNRGPRVTSARLVRPDAEPLRAKLRQVEERGLTAVRLDQPVGPGVVRLEVAFEAEYGARLSGLYRVQAEGHHYAFTQFEAQSAREAFPCFDEPRFKTPFDVTLRVKQGDVAVANTLAAQSETLESGLREIKFKTTEKLPTYLVAFAVGPLDHHPTDGASPNAVRAETLPLGGYAVKGHGPELAYAMEQTPVLLENLERYFATAYPYDKLDLLAVPDFAAGAMENAGAITFRDSLLLIGDDADEGQKRRLAYVNAHELAHQWFGNLVTMPWWDDIWLNEAFATWMGTRVVKAVYPEYHAERSELLYTHHAMGVDARASARQIRQPILTDHDVDNAFDAITYAKGGAVLAMFERYLGAEAFQAGLRLYMSRHRFGSATAEDLMAALAEASGRAEVPGAFRSFLEQPGVPLVETRLSCQAGGRPLLKLKQSRYLPLGSEASRDHRWQLPFCARYGAGEQVQTQCALLTEPESELALNGAACPDWVLPNAEANGYYRWAVDAGQWAQLVKARASLSATEKMSLADNLVASLRAGASAPDVTLEALLELAQGAERGLLESVLSALHELRLQTLKPEQLPGYRARLDALLRPYYRRLGLFPKAGVTEDGETKLLRATVVRALGLEAEASDVRAELVRLGRAELGLGRHPRLSELSPELLGAALQAAVQDSGAPVLERAGQKLRDEKSGTARARLLSAVSSPYDPALTESVLALSLHPKLRTNERVAPIFGQLRRPETREAAYAWLKAHFAELTEHLSGHGGARVFAAFDTFCSERAGEQVASDFTERAEQLSGGPRELRLALESVRLCTAFSEAQGAQVRAFFASGEAKPPSEKASARR